MVNPAEVATSQERLTDEEVVTRVMAGETGMFEIVMRRHNQRLYRVARAILRNDGVSSPGELHPEALAEPDVNLSAHPAPIKQTCQSYRYPSGRREPFAPGQAVAETGLPGSYGL